MKFRDELIKEKNREKEEKHINQEILRNKNGICYIPVGHRGQTLEFLVDEIHWLDLMKYTWTATFCGNYAHGKDETGKDWRLHVYIHHHYIGEILEDHTVDHIKSQHPRDNRKQNLRILSFSGQSHNTIKNREIKLPRGVYLNKGKFTAMVQRKYLGRYETVEEAAEMYNIVEKEKQGDNAILNKITTKGTTVEKYINSILTLEYIQNITTVVQLQEVLRVKQDWKKSLKIGYDHIKRNNLKG